VNLREMGLDWKKSMWIDEVDANLDDEEKWNQR
jgi:hypothetical protein